MANCTDTSKPAGHPDPPDEPRGQVPRMRSGWLATGAVFLLVAGVALSHRVEPGVRVESVTLAGDVPALRFIPAQPGPCPIALLAHGVTASKETLFRFSEALAAAGFLCVAVDLPGHGASGRRFAPEDNASTLERVGAALGKVDVFLGHSMGAGAGAASVRRGGLVPQHGDRR